MKQEISSTFLKFILPCYLLFSAFEVQAQILAFPGAEGFGRYAKGARGDANPSIYIVNNLNDNGLGSFRDAVSKAGRFVVFDVSGIIKLESTLSVAPNITIAAQTAPGDGIVLYNKRVSFSAANELICRFLRIRLGAENNAGQDASGLANGKNMIFDHLSVTWGMDEVFSINWDKRGESPDNITIQNSIIGQGLHRENHSAGGLIQPPTGKVSLIRNLYISNKTRNPKVKGINEFVNNVIYNWGNMENAHNHLESADAYIMGGSAGVSEVNIINNYFMSGPLTPNIKTPFSRGTPTFFLYGSGNMFDNNKNGVLDGELIPYSENGYPGIAEEGFKNDPFAYPKSETTLDAKAAYYWVIENVGAVRPKRDEVDELLIKEVASFGKSGRYVYTEKDIPLSNNGLGRFNKTSTKIDTDQDGISDEWEDKNGLDKANPEDALMPNKFQPDYLNIEVYFNSLIK